MSDNPIRDFIEQRETELAEFKYREAVRRRQEREAHQKMKVRLEKFLDDYAFHTGLDLTIPENMAKACASAVEWLAQGRDEF
jgi:hypothetical protein